MENGNIMNIAAQFILDRIQEENIALLNDVYIKKLNAFGVLVEQPLNEIQIQPNSIDVTLGNTWKTIKPNSSIGSNNLIIDTSLPIQYEEGVFDTDENGREYYIVDSQEFILMATNEILNIPNGIVGIICGRSSIARLGIQTEQAGFIDSGFRGSITLEVHNQTKYPIKLYKDMRVAQIYFIKGQCAENVYGDGRMSKYNNQIDATGSRIHLDVEFNTLK